jgi:hypothetical protein
MTLGAYQEAGHFAYPGWRLTVPGGPAGGHYKGFTHTQAAGTDLLPQDQYEQDREDGMSSHDAVHASPRNPRGVYRSSGEVPPRPNASGSAMTYRGMQTERHPGTAVAPGSFPAEFIETLEDAFLSGMAAGDGMGRWVIDGGGSAPIDIVGPAIDAGPAIIRSYPPQRPNAVACPMEHAAPPSGFHWMPVGTDANGCAIVQLVPDPQTGPTSVVNQPPASPMPMPPAPSVSAGPPRVSPRPAPTVPTHEVVTSGTGDYIDVSTGQIVPASSITQNPATGQLSVSGALSWLERPSSLWSALPNWGLLAGALLLTVVMGGKRR